MGPLWQTFTELGQGAEALRRRRYGVIEAQSGQFRRIRLRPWPELLSLPELLLGQWRHRRRPGDWCLVYYNQPWRFRNYLAVTYMLSGRETTLATVYRALEALDEVARLKGADALLCDAMNWRISTELLARLGWAPHCPSRWHRHYIKRFYGDYPPRPGWMVAGHA